VQSGRISESDVEAAILSTALNALRAQ
jgi:hypothetical protein